MSGSAPSGTTTSNDRPGATPKNPGGVTPTIVSGTRPSVSVRPITSRAPPKYDCQNAWLITTTGPPLPPPRTSSDGWNSRPSAGVTPSTSKAPALAHTPLTKWLSPPVLKSKSASNPVHANAPSNRAACSLDLLPDRVGPRPLLRRRPGDELRQPLGILDWQRPEEEAVDDGEDRRVGADAQRERGDDHGGERALPGEEPERVANVAAEVIEKCAVTARTNAFFHPLDAPDLGEGEAASLGGRNAFLDPVRGGHLDERPDLVVELLLGAIPAEDPGRDGRQATKDSHAPSSTLAMANDTRSQRRRCCSSCLRPDAVSA